MEMCRELYLSEYYPNPEMNEKLLKCYQKLQIPE
jgi:hypothetical protein